MTSKDTPPRRMSTTRPATSFLSARAARARWGRFGAARRPAAGVPFEWTAAGRTGDLSRRGAGRPTPAGPGSSPRSVKRLRTHICGAARSRFGQDARRSLQNPFGRCLPCVKMISFRVGERRKSVVDIAERPGSTTRIKRSSVENRVEDIGPNHCRRFRAGFYWIHYGFSDKAGRIRTRDFHSLDCVTNRFPYKCGSFCSCLYWIENSFLYETSSLGTCCSYWLQNTLPDECRCLIACFHWIAHCLPNKTGCSGASCSNRLNYTFAYKAGSFHEQSLSWHNCACRRNLRELVTF